MVTELLNLSTENTCGLNWATLHVMTCRTSWDFCNKSHQLCQPTWHGCQTKILLNIMQWPTQLLSSILVNSVQKPKVSDKSLFHKILQSSRFRNSDNPALQSSHNTIKFCFFTRKKASSIKQENIMDMFNKGSTSAYTSTPWYLLNPCLLLHQLLQL